MNWLNEAQGWLNTIGVIGGPLLVLWQLVKTKQAAVSAAGKAEVAASDAATHAQSATTAVTGMAGDIAELTVNTNSIKDALVKTSGELGRLAGREEMRIEQSENKS